MDTLTLEISLGLITAAVVGLVEIAKGVGLPSAYAPILAVILGVAGLLLVAFFQPIAAVIFTGIVVGLSACGLYSGVKTVGSAIFGK